MCGIAGILNLLEYINENELNKFTDSLIHRGPDDRGIFIDEKMGLGHRRLSILDLSEAGRCPMSYGGEDGKRYWITYNGEVFNFIELRAELESLGHKFRTQTDTEVILASYDQWGENCLYKFNGMWAFAIWDTKAKKLFIARDRFGIKPLYYMKSPKRFAFASELKAFLSLDKFSPKLNEPVLEDINKFAQGYEAITDNTLMKFVKKLLPGHSMTVNNNLDINIKKWWDTREHIPVIPTKYNDQVEMFREIFLDAVKIRMRSDVALGTSLSGGIDSSAVASSMRYIVDNQKEKIDRFSNNWQKTFIATFPGSFLDEKVYADMVVEHIQAKPTYIVFDQKVSTSHFIDTLWSMEEIYPGLAMPIWQTYKAMRDNGITVTLDGHGGDELLAGYTYYLNYKVKDLNNTLYNDFHYSVLPAILKNYDRCSMAHGIEVRMPIMDWRLVTFAFGLPPESKLGGTFTKRAFRDAMKGIMPETVRRRRSKIGFNSPMSELFNGSLSNLIINIVNHPFWIESPYWDGKGIRNIILEKTVNKSWKEEDWGYCLSVWKYLNIVLWYLLFIKNDRSSVEKMLNSVV